jgi:hypothetical protein
MLFKAVLAPILGTLIALSAHAADLGTSLREAVSKGMAAEAEIQAAINEIAKQGEAQTTAIMTKAFPASAISSKVPEVMMLHLTLFSALQKHGTPEFTSYLLYLLEQTKGKESTMRNMVIYSLLTCGKSNVARVKEFLNAYRKTQTDKDTVHAIGVFLEAIDAQIYRAENPPPAEVNVPARVEEMAGRLRTSWYQCPGKIWPHNMQPQAVFIDTDGNRAWLVNEAGLKALPAVPENLTHDFKFDFSEYENRPAIAVKLQSTFGSDAEYKGSYALYLAFHEGFHHMFQQGEWMSDGNFQRGDRYPADYKSRYYRRMMYENLKKALMEPATKSTSVGRASYWYQKWTSEFASEIPQAVDRQEGVAMFYDVAAVSLGHVGCQSGKAEVANFIRSNYDMFFQIPEGFDNEGYNVGGLATMQLWLGNQADWQLSIIRGKSPVELLLKDVRPIAEPDSADILQQTKTKSAEKDKSVRRNLHGDLENLKSADYIRVAIGRDWYTDNLPMKVMVIPQIYPEAFIFVTDEGYSPSGDSGNLKATGPLPLFKGFNNPCGSRDGTDFVLFKKDQITGNGTYRGKSNYAEFEARADEKIAGGFKWLCPK